MILLTLLSCRGREVKGGEEYRVFVRIDTVSLERLERDVPVWCRARGEGDFTVVSDVAGVVSRIVRREGEWVSRGDTILYVYRGPSFGEAPILSPANGRIAIITTAVGNPVAAGTPVALVSGRGGIAVEMVIPGGKIGIVRPGMTVLFDGRRGRLEVLSRVPVRELGGYPARAKLPGVRDGEMGVCRVIYEESPSMTVVPSSAVYNGRVFVVRKGRARSVPVKVLFDDGKGHVGVEGALHRGDTVVVLGMESLRDGDRVVF